MIISFHKRGSSLIPVLIVTETLSEAVKMLKGEYCIRAINKHKMDRAIIFCRTKLDCDNLEKYFNQISRYLVFTLKSESKSVVDFHKILAMPIE